MIKKFVLISFFLLFISSCTSLENLSGRKTAKEFFTSPMLNEFGQEVETNYFKSKSTENFNMEICGTIESEDEISFEFMFSIKNRDIKIEYVKVQSVVPNDLLTFVDETQKNKNPNSSVKVFTEIIDKKDLYAWHGVVSNMPYIVYNPTYLNRYLFKFTIKPVGKPETIIYQPCFLKVLIFNSKK